MPFVYILHSPAADRFYTGATKASPESRLQRHLDEYYGSKKFTSKYKDWALFHSIQCRSYSQARKIENHIKKMKNKNYIRNLKKYPEIEEKLLSMYS